MPQRLLAILTDVPQSGDDLGQSLGLGRVSVNTLARRLQEQGVPLSISRAGYVLEAGTPAPGLVPVRGKFGRALRYFGEIGSTQDELRAWAADPLDPAPHGAAVVAERQTAGRGRRGRVWQTGQGNLVFSVLLRGPLPLSQLPTLPLAAGVALQRAAQGGRLKWPNDLLDSEGRKLAGILLEADLRGEEARQAVLGIGLNVTEAPPGAGTLAAYRPGVSRAQLLADLLAELEHWLSVPTPEVLQAWREVSATLGQQVRFQLPGQPQEIEGVARDIDAQGSLLVTLPGGREVSVGAGDVELVGRLA